MERRIGRTRGYKVTIKRQSMAERRRTNADAVAQPVIPGALEGNEPAPAAQAQYVSESAPLDVPVKKQNVQPRTPAPLPRKKTHHH